MEPSSKIESVDAQIEIFDKKVDIEISITESGKIEIDILNSPQFELTSELLDRELQENIKILEGTTSGESKIKISNLIALFSFRVEKDTNTKISQILKPRKVEIYKNADTVSHKGTDVTIKFDVICLKHIHPPTVRSNINLLSQENLKISATPLSDLNDRIEFIKSHKIPLRTIQINITQDIPGDISHQMIEAEKKLERILELAGFVQGVGPSYIRAELYSIDGEPVESRDEEIRYKKYFSNTGNIGGAFKFGHLVRGNEYTKYLDEAYEAYNDEIRDNYRLKMVLGYYWDALNITRPIQGRFLSVCSAIELLSKRYSDIRQTHSETQEKIEYLIDELNVKTQDLASHSGTYEKSSSQDYFYSYSRQFVVHGDNTPPQEELRDDFFAALTLLQRIIRNQLLDTSGLDDYNELSELTPIEVLDFD